MPDFTAVDPDVLDDVAAYGPDVDVESPDERSDRLSRAFEQGATLRLAPPPGEPSTDDESGAPVKQRRRRGPNKARGIGGSQIGTLFITGFTLLIGFTVGEWAQPTQAEADAMAVPLGNILARRIDLAGKLGRNTDDVVNLAIAIMAYMARIGPIAAGRAQDAWRERQRARPGADRPPQPLNSRGTGPVPPGNNDEQGTPTSAADNPLDAYASIAERQLRSLGFHTGPG